MGCSYTFLKQYHIYVEEWLCGGDLELSCNKLENQDDEI